MKIKTVSAELVGAIVGIGVSKVEFGGKKIWYLRDGGDTLHSGMDVVRFAAKCRRWMMNNGHSFSIGYDGDSKLVSVEINEREFSSYYEDEAVILAAEWVCDNEDV